MEFRLPENLHHQLLAYDPALKALVKEQKAANKPEGERKKAKYPIGNINDLIPANIVDPAAMQTVIDRLNLNIAPNKHHVFYSSSSSIAVTAKLSNPPNNFSYIFSHISTDKSTKSTIPSSVFFFATIAQLP